MLPIGRAFIHTLTLTGRFIIALFCVFSGAHAFAAELPADAARRLAQGESVNLIVEYAPPAAPPEVTVDTSKRMPVLDAKALDDRRRLFQELRRTVDEAESLPMVQRLQDYTQLPMALRRFLSFEQARAYAAHANVKAIYEDVLLQPTLAQSLPLIGQPTVAQAVDAGAGTTVAVIDTGINYGLPAFGSCTAPGVPAGCKVVTSINFGTGTTDNSHGTNVSAIALGVASGAKVAMLNAFSGTSALTSDVIKAINWAIANQATYNIASINMSLSQAGIWFDAPCSSANVFLTPVTNARQAGMAVTVSAGNDAHKTGISMPACTPGVLSVGAVYDSNMGSMGWGNGLCTDTTTAADKVTCFSNSSGILKLLAPGALITAAGYTMAGTSQAAPHVAGAVAVLRSLYPQETLDQVEARLTTKGKMVTDPANGIVTPRLDLLAAAQPANDAFAAAITISGASGSVAGGNLLASKEMGEPNHAGNTGGRSVWWRWVAPASGQMTLDTHGVGFDSLLAVYTGNDVATLTPIAANDNDPAVNDGSSRVVFQAQSGTEYRIAIDGFNGASGDTVLNWALNTAAQANVAVTLSGTATGTDTVDYSINVSNLGPQAATGIVVTVTLPTNARFISASPACQSAGTQVTCALGYLASNSSAAFSLQLGWVAGAGYQISATVQSDVPDPQGTNNSQTASILPGISADGDVPTLPEWGVILMIALLMVTIGRSGATVSFVRLR